MHIQEIVAIVISAILLCLSVMWAIRIAGRKRKKHNKEEKKEVLYCYNCGSVIPDGYQYCPTCEWWREF